MQQAIVDRLEGNIAVLIIDNEPRNVPLEALPLGTKAGDYLQVEINEGKIASAAIDAQATSAARSRIEQKLERLRRGKHIQK